MRSSAAHSRPSPLRVNVPSFAVVTGGKTGFRAAVPEVVPLERPEVLIDQGLVELPRLDVVGKGGDVVVLREVQPDDADRGPDHGLSLQVLDRPLDGHLGGYADRDLVAGVDRGGPPPDRQARGDGQHGAGTPQVPAVLVVTAGGQVGSFDLEGERPVGPALAAGPQRGGAGPVQEEPELGALHRLAVRPGDGAGVLEHVGLGGGGGLRGRLVLLRRVRLRVTGQPEGHADRQDRRGQERPGGPEAEGRAAADGSQRGDGRGGHGGRRDCGANQDRRRTGPGRHGDGRQQAGRQGDAAADEPLAQPLAAALEGPLDRPDGAAESAAPPRRGSARPGSRARAAAGRRPAGGRVPRGGRRTPPATTGPGPHEVARAARDSIAPRRLPGDPGLQRRAVGDAEQPARPGPRPAEAVRPVRSGRRTRPGRRRRRRPGREDPRQAASTRGAVPADEGLERGRVVGGRKRSSRSASARSSAARVRDRLWTRRERGSVVTGRPPGSAVAPDSVTTGGGRPYQFAGVIVTRLATRCEQVKRPAPRIGAPSPLRRGGSNWAIVVARIAGVPEARALAFRYRVAASRPGAETRRSCGGSVFNTPGSFVSPGLARNENVVPRLVGGHLQLAQVLLLAGLQVTVSLASRTMWTSAVCTPALGPRGDRHATPISRGRGTVVLKTMGLRLQEPPGRLLDGRIRDELSVTDCRLTRRLELATV